MARKVARCLRKNYKKKVKANAKSEQQAAESANEIAALFKGVGDLEAAKRTVAMATNLNGNKKRKDGNSLAATKRSLLNNTRKAAADVGGKKKMAGKKTLLKKTLFGNEDDEDDDNVSASSEEEDLEDELDEQEDASLALPDVNLLETEEQLIKYRTLLRKQQVREKMTLREHMRELEKKKNAMRGGKRVAEDLRREKRDLGKYMKQLEEEQKAKHANAMRDVEIRIAQMENSRKDPFLIAGEKAKAKNRLKLLGAAASATGIYQSGIAAAFSPDLANAGRQENYANSGIGFGGRGDYSEYVGANELQNMFAHLM